jgi:hypothetical protein
MLIIIASLTECVLAQTRVPQFKDYPVREQFTGKNAPLVLTRKDRAYRTRLSDAAKEKPNFAGHYILAAWGCGTECLMGALIDAKTGRVYWIPFTVCCWGTGVDNNVRAINLRPDSRLIVFTGARNEEGNGTYFYKFENNRFVFVHSIEKLK